MAQELEKVDPTTGEVMSFQESNAPLAVMLAQAELNQAVTTAKAFPRNVPAVVRKIMELATIDEESAKEAVYALPRGGKPIKGPSIRFAEIVASMWGNCHTGTRIVDVDRFEKVIVAEGVFLDLETGMRRTAQIRRRISGKDGRLFNDDMITVTGNAAASIAMREAILKGIPKAVWRKAYDHCEKVIAGDVATLNVRRDEALKAFAVWGIKPEQIFAALEIEGIDGIGLDEIATLVAMHKAIRAGEQKVEDYFPAKANASDAVEAAKGTAAKLNKVAEQGKAANDQAKNGAKADEQGKGAKAEGKGEPAGEKAGAEGGGNRAGNAGGSSESQADRAAGDEEGASGGGGDSGEGDERTFTDDEIEAAFQRGEEASQKGMSRRSMPAEWKADGFEPLADAWVRGFTGTEA